MIRTRPDLAKHVWTTKRKLMGNLLPAILASPFLAVGLWLIWKEAAIFGRGFVVLCGFPVVLWLSVNYLGLFQNKAMRREMQQRLRAARPTVTSRRFFVGAATPKHTGYLDPHEDVGYLILHPERIEFFGETVNATIARSELESVEFRPNVHSLAGLGRWVRLSGHSDGKPIRLDVELREKDTLLGNRKLSKDLKNRLQLWQKETTPENPPEP